MVLDRINKPNDIHNIPLQDFPELAHEIRKYLIAAVSKTGGHLASNLGVVELTLALHNVLNFPEDKLIWDVGHQSYTHKILTGRKDALEHLRQEGGISGFPKRAESDCDAFDTGHSSNSISAALGYAKARDLKGGRGVVAAVIGDGAMTGGMAFEALNNAALMKTNFIIVLNDNTMSISKNVGGMSTYLSALRTAAPYTGLKLEVTKSLSKVPGIGPASVAAVRRTKSSIKQLIIPGMFFEDMGITYLGPADGHDMRQMMRLFNEAKKVQGPVLVHVLTEKGRGYEPARLHPDRFHGTGPFCIRTGAQLTGNGLPSYTSVFSDEMVRLGAQYEKLTAVTAAMAEGTGLKAFSKRYPERFFDVGIAEQHAVTFSAGLSLGGMIPVAAVYSSFLQRAFDQILHDVCMQNLHVIFAIDRAGIVGADGETHHGNFDLSYLLMMPNMTVMAPRDAAKFREMLRLAVSMDGPVAIRYPRGEAPAEVGSSRKPLVRGKSEILCEGRKIAILSIGSMTSVCMKAVTQLHGEGIRPTLVDAVFAKPLDTETLDLLAGTHDEIITAEENVLSGGFGEQVREYLSKNHPETRVTCLGIGDCFVTHGKPDQLRMEQGLSPECIADLVRSRMQ